MVCGGFPTEVLRSPIPTVQRSPSQLVRGLWAHSPQRPGSAPFLLVLAGMHSAESQQRIVKPFPSRQTMPRRAYWMTDFKADGSTSNRVYELRRTQAVTYQYLAFPTSPRHPSLLFMPRHNLLTITKQWELENSSFEDVVHLLLISIRCW